LWFGIPQGRDDFVESPTQKILRMNVRSARSAGTGTPVIRRLFTHGAAAPGERKIMNVESLAIENQEAETQTAVESAPEVAFDSLPCETLALIGGGSSVVLL
jgi:hypothetical protein